MGDLVRFPARRRADNVDTVPRICSLADKLQWLVLTYPAAAKEIEAMIDRLRYWLESS